MFNFCDYEWNSVQLDTTNHAGWVFCWSCVWSDTLFCHSFLVPRVGRVEPMNFLYPFSVAFPASISSGRGSKLCFEIFYRRSGREGIPIALTTSLVAIFAKLFWKLLLHRMAPSYPNKSIKTLGGRYLRPHGTCHELADILSSESSRLNTELMADKTSLRLHRHFSDNTTTVETASLSKLVLVAHRFNCC